MSKAALSNVARCAAVVLCFQYGWLNPSSSLAEDAWGHLSGRFIYDGEPPAPRNIDVTSDVKTLGPSVRDESMLVHAKNRGVANVLVYLLTKKDQKLSIHPSYAKSAKAKLTLTMEKGRFEPHVMLLRTGQTLVWRNRDAVSHNQMIHIRDHHM